MRPLELRSEDRPPEWSSGHPGGGCGRADCDLRCGCGNLLARRVAEGVELKCRRCKRTCVLPLADG